MSLSARRIVITGGSGFLGLSLATTLAELGAEVVLVSRHAPRRSGPWRHRLWDGRTSGDWAEELNGASGVVNLAGRSVDCRKTPENADAILRSRVESCRALGLACRGVARPPSVWVQMSTAHLYGDSLLPCDEDSATGYGLAPDVARAWEEAFAEWRLPEQRGVIQRTSFVLGRDRGAGSGALDRLLPLARWGLGGTIGSGKQGMSWIHEADLNALFVRALIDPAMRGAYVASAPQPLPQREFARELRRAVGMPLGLPATEAMVRLGAYWLLDTDPELALYGRFVTSRRLAEEGFSFRFPSLGPALADLLGGQPRWQRESAGR